LVLHLLQKVYSSVVDHVFLSGTELRVPLDDLVNRIKQILLRNALSPGANRKHTGLCAHRTNISSCRVGTKTRNQLKADVFIESHRLCIDLEDLFTAF